MVELAVVIKWYSRPRGAIRDELARASGSALQPAFLAMRPIGLANPSSVWRVAAVAVCGLDRGCSREG